MRLSQAIESYIAFPGPGSEALSSAPRSIASPDWIEVHDIPERGVGRRRAVPQIAFGFAPLEQAHGRSRITLLFI